MIRALPVLLLVTPAAAQTPRIFELPEGCDAFVTIQSRNCSVEHHFTCEADPDGVKRRVSLSEDGMTYLGSTDEETQWLNSFHPLSGHTERLEDAPPDRASLSDLLATGSDSYEFTTLSDEVGPTRYVGEDRLTGNLVTIDDVTLRETEYEITAYGSTGEELWSSAGNEFVSERWRMFIGGTGRVTTAGDAFEKNDSPVEFIYPGEPGFLSANPKHDCGAMMSLLDLP